MRVLREGSKIVLIFSNFKKCLFHRTQGLNGLVHIRQQVMYEYSKNIAHAME